MNRAKELKRMKRQELLELLLDVTEENEALKEKIASLEKQLASREIALSDAGSIAEASLRLGGVFSAAQKAADIYLYNLKRADEKAGEILRNAEQEADQIKKRAEQTAAELLDRARSQALEEMKQRI